MAYLEEGEWRLLGKLPKQDKQRLAFYDKLFGEICLRKIKLELIVKYNDYSDSFLIIEKRQMVTYNTKLP